MYLRNDQTGHSAHGVEQSQTSTMNNTATYKNALATILEAQHLVTVMTDESDSVDTPQWF
jgi:hypothetical protein